MKRFYKEAGAAPVEGGWQIALDGRPVKTPARAALVLPTEKLGQAVVEEWRDQGEDIVPRTMPLTGLANAAIDRVAPDPATFAQGLAQYGESDLLCYRAEGPQPLVARQSELWDPLLAWARRRYDIDFEVAAGIMHRPQHPETIERLARAVAARDAFHLAALSPLVTVSGSLVLALAIAEEAIDLEAGWAAATLDEQWQIEQWGEDAEAAAMLASRRQDFEAGHRLLTLL
ncbi:MAG: Chaperone required for the assembly of the mitochondrial F1-ATPase [uncultured Sphingosinicella sp.]|uniref:Chaperone required for the assembly of the mitochondrial F1-ATPase n=1 Tax=uncultured Sphingosinicella sp. TaxID=478748 RepID=A0A6J4U3I2_9SPHN|nr:ATP12 family protein [uncultured Sphingosinicella sp.]CAA9539718.1 MAG: Chaperone required for the assembly of the mitochondrial F1-ATPase [uncultured Sphingosinicella sp.]